MCVYVCMCIYIYIINTVDPAAGPQGSLLRKTSRQTVATDPHNSGRERCQAVRHGVLVYWCVTVSDISPPHAGSLEGIAMYLGHETSKAFASVGLEELGFQVTRASHLMEKEDLPQFPAATRQAPAFLQFLCMILCLRCSCSLEIAAWHSQMAGAAHLETKLLVRTQVPSNDIVALSTGAEWSGNSCKPWRDILKDPPPDSKPLKKQSTMYIYIYICICICTRKLTLHYITLH